MKTTTKKNDSKIILSKINKKLDGLFIASRIGAVNTQTRNVDTNELVREDKKPVCYISLTRNCLQQEAHIVMKSCQKLLSDNGIEGFVLLETEEQFRITPLSLNEQQDDRTSTTNNQEPS